MSAGTCAPPGQVPPSNSARSAPTVSSSSATRSLALGYGNPYISCSGFDAASPVPSARIAFPLLIWSSAAACFARSPGARNVTRATSVPTCNAGCSAAAAASVVNDSSAGRSGPDGG